MKQGEKRLPKTCYRCGKEVSIQYSGRCAPPGEPVSHKCPHGNECIGMSGWGGSVGCRACNEERGVLPEFEGAT